MVTSTDAATDRSTVIGSPPSSARRPIRIGGASGFWGDAALATGQLLNTGNLDFLVYDYLAEITLSIMARARAVDSSKGYAVDFVSAAMRPNLARIAREGVRVVSNAGGLNPQACAEALRDEIRAQGLALRVAVVLGDDLSAQAADLATLREMFTGDVFPEPEAIVSINAYLGAFPIAAALDAGADIVVTGRCVDSAVTLGACIHAFDWRAEQWDELAQGSLAGHLLECGTQATGGNYTDWDALGKALFSAGYPIAEVSASGEFTIGKPPGTGGLVSVGTVGEQMLYEIGDPGAYVLPDVICDFRGVTLQQCADDCVAVRGARGVGVPEAYKVSVTWADGFRTGQIWTMLGRDAPRKAQLLADAMLGRTASALSDRGLAPLTEASVEIIGVESHYGAGARSLGVREVDFKIAARHPSAAGLGIFLKEMVGLALTAPPGLTGFAGARPKATPVVRLFSCLLAKSAVTVTLEIDGQPLTYAEPLPDLEPRDHGHGPRVAVSPPPTPPAPQDCVSVPLEALAYARSGDKGDKANIGVLARDPVFLPWIAASLSADSVAESFAHFLEPNQTQAVECFYLPGCHGLNFLLHRVLGGGGVASLRADPQGKTYAQLLLARPIAIPRALAHAHGLTDFLPPSEHGLSHG